MTFAILLTANTMLPTVGSLKIGQKLVFVRPND